MIHTVASAADLPLGTGNRTTYVVSSIDPRYVIEYREGAVFERADGTPWEGDGYHLSRRVGGAVTVDPANIIMESTRKR